MKKNLKLCIGAFCLCLGLMACAPDPPSDSPENPTNAPTNVSETEPSSVPTAAPVTEAPSESQADAGKLKGYLNMVKRYNLDAYVNKDIMNAPIQHAEELIVAGTATQEEYDMALQALKDALSLLHDGSGWPNFKYMQAKEEYPDALTFLNGTKVETAEDWKARADEILGMYQYYMYGVIRDGSDETLTYDYNGSTATLTITRGEHSGKFTINISLPDESKVEMPEGGWPVIMALGWFAQTPYANNRGYAVITFDYTKVASDDITRKGAFYDVYPYGETWEEQTGALAAWGWGFSKIIDALEQGLGETCHINPKNTIVTGVSRCGKSAAVAGAFDERIRISVPACSGAGGMAMFRYSSEGHTYDFSSIGSDAAYTFGDNEPLSSLQSGAERHWFNDNFKEFSNVNKFPFDQHMLASLYAGRDRYLFIISSYIYEDWTNPPAMWETYKEAKKIFEFLGEGDHIAFQIHKEGHAVIDEDVVALLDFADYHLYGKTDLETDFAKFDTCIFAEQEPITQ